MQEVTQIAKNECVIIKIAYRIKGNKGKKILLDETPI